MKALAGMKKFRNPLADILADLLVDAIIAMLDLYRRNVTMAGWTPNGCNGTFGNPKGTTIACGSFPITKTLYNSTPPHPVYFSGSGFWRLSFTSNPTNTVPFDPDRYQITTFGNWQKAGTAPPNPMPNNWNPNVWLPHLRPEEQPFGEQPQAPEVPETVDPMQKPIMRPEVGHKPLPYRMLPGRGYNPYRAWGEQSQRGNVAPRDQRVPGSENWPGFIRLPRRDSPPLVETPGQPGPDIEITTGKRHATAGQPSRHFKRRPGRRTKEKKIVITAKKGLWYQFYNLNTEAKDLIEAFWEALPLKYRRLPDGYILPPGVVRTNKKKPMPKPHEMLQDLYENWQHLDGQKAVENIIKNEIGDRLTAAAGKASARASRRLDMSHGIQLGPLF